MKRPRILRRTVVGGAVVTVLLAVIGGLAYAQTGGGSQASGSPSMSSPSSSSPAPSLSSTPGTTPLAKGTNRRRILKRAVHVEVVAKTSSGYETVDIDRGAVQSVSSGSITITRPDGPQVTAKITPTTKFQGTQQGQVQQGQRVVVIQTGGNALSVSVPRAKASGSIPNTGSTPAAGSTPTTG